MKVSDILPFVGSRYGSPTGRTTSPLGQGIKSVNLFKVRLDSGGYDQGGAYWGLGGALWCAYCDEGGRQFIRAGSRISAAFALDISPNHLKRGFNKEDLANYCYSLIDGRAPFPSGKDKTNIKPWLNGN